MSQHGRKAKELKFLFGQLFISVSNITVISAVRRVYILLLHTSYINTIWLLELFYANWIDRFFGRIECNGFIAIYQSLEADILAITPMRNAFKKTLVRTSKSVRGIRNLVNGSKNGTWNDKSLISYYTIRVLSIDPLLHLLLFGIAANEFVHFIIVTLASDLAQFKLLNSNINVRACFCAPRLGVYRWSCLAFWPFTSVSSHPLLIGSFSVAETSILFASKKQARCWRCSSTTFLGAFLCGDDGVDPTSSCSGKLGTSNNCEPEDEKKPAIEYLRQFIWDHTIHRQFLL